MKQLISLLLAGILCLSLCACREETPVVSQTPSPQPTAQPEETKEFALAYDPTAELNPITGESRVNQMLTSLVYESLYRLDETFAPQPVLAQGAEVDESGLVWTISVREDVVFSDGTPLEAKHVVSSLKLAMKSTLYGGRLSKVESVKAKDGTVVIRLTEPNGGLLSLLDLPVILETEEGVVPLGTGRYRYVQDGERVYLLQNYHRDEELPCSLIPLYTATTVNERIETFDSGLVSAVVTDLTSPYAMGYSGSYEIWDYDTTDLLYVGFKAVESPCESVFVRQAFAKAFDRAAIVKEILDEHGVEAKLPVHPMHENWHEEAASTLEYDLQAAAELLGQAGYQRDEETGLLRRKKETLEVTLLVNSDNGAKLAIADRLAEAMTSLGVAVTVSKLPWKDYMTALTTGAFDLYLGEVRLTADFDVTELLTGSLNYGGFDSALLESALVKRNTTTGHQRYWYSRALWEDFVQEVPIAPLCFKKESLLLTWGMGIHPTPLRGDPFFGMEHWPSRRVG